MTTEQATRAAILSAVRAFVQRVETRAHVYTTKGTVIMDWSAAMYAELAALERAAAEDAAPEGGAGP